MSRCFSPTCNCHHRCQFAINSSCQKDPTYMDFPEFSEESQNGESKGDLDLAIKRKVIYNIFFP